MSGDYEHSDLSEAQQEAARRLKLLDPSWMASRSATTYSYSGGLFLVPLFDDRYVVRYPTEEVEKEDGGAAGAREALIILHYLTVADGTQVREQWVAYRDLPGARYHEPAFVTDVERPLSLGLAGHLETLRRWSQGRVRALDLPGDAAFAWYALPRVPLLVIFNEADEEFPASARMMFDISAPNYLPTEDLSVLADIASERLLDEIRDMEVDDD